MLILPRMDFSCEVFSWISFINILMAGGPERMKEMSSEAAVKKDVTMQGLEAKNAAASSSKVRTMTVVAMLSAVATVLMELDFSVPMLIPGFVKMDLSELPALIGSFAMGPVAGVLVCLIKNLIHLTHTSTGGVGELCNFLLGALFVFPAGLFYKLKKTKKNAIIGALLGSVVMAVISIFVNGFITYPMYTKFMPMEAIIQASQAIIPSVKDLWSCLIIFNMPFNFVKCLCSVLITMLIYKPLSPILKGKA